MEFKDFDKHFEDFDNHFEQTRKMAVIGAIVSLIISIGGISFFIWIVLKLMSHFGVI